MWTGAFIRKCIPYYMALLGVMVASNYLQVVPKSQSKPWVVLMSDGRYKAVTGEYYQACGIGPGLVYLQIPGAQPNDESCYNENYIRLKRGTVNQVSTDTLRMYYASSPVTYIEFQWYRRATATLRLAATYGKINKGRTIPRDVTFTGSVTYTDDNTLHVTSYKSTAGSTITATNGWHICDTSTVSCKEAVTVQQGVSYYLAFGVGVQQIVIGKTSEQSTSLVIENAAWVQDPTMYMTSSRDTTIYNPVPIGIEVESWLAHGAPSIYKLKVDKLAESSRPKRTPALALAIANRLELDAIQDANRAALAASDRNTVKLRDKLFDLEVAQKDLAISVGRQLRRYEAQQVEVRVTNRETDYLRTLAADLGKKQRAISITFMKTARFLQLKEKDVDDDYPEVRKKILDLTGDRIVLEYSDPDNYYFILTPQKDGKPVVTNDPDALCTSTYCHHTGSWSHITGTGEMVQVNGPLVAAMSCGFFLKGAADTEIAIIKNQPDPESRLSYIQANPDKFTYSYGSPRDCTEYEETMANSVLDTARTFLKNSGYDAIRVDEEGKYSIDCSKYFPDNMTDDAMNSTFNGTKPVGLNESLVKYMERSQLCDRKMNADEFLSNAIALTPKMVQIESTLDAFDKIMAEENEIGAAFNRLVKGGVGTFAELAGIAKDSWDYAFGDGPQNMEKMVKGTLAFSIISAVASILFAIIIICKMNAKEQLEQNKEDIHLGEMTQAKKDERVEEDMEIDLSIS